MIDPDSLERVAQLIAERYLKRFAEEVRQKKAEFHRRGLLQSSCFEQALGELAVIKSRELAEAVADVIAQACGSDAYLHVGILQKVYEKAKLRFLASYRKNQIEDFNSSNMIRKIRKAIEPQIEANFANCLDELHLGMVRGKTILGSGLGNVNNYNIYGGTGIAVGSNNVAIHVGQGNLIQTIGWDRDALLQAIQGLREALASRDIPVKSKEELNDVVVKLEREATSKSPDFGQLRRLAKWLLDRVQALGDGVFSSLVVNNYFPAITAALPQ